MALFKRKTDRSKAKLEKILKGSQVPTLPKVALQILQKIRDSDASMQEIVERLENLRARMRLTILLTFFWEKMNTTRTTRQQIISMRLGFNFSPIADWGACSKCFLWFSPQ